MRGGRIAGIKFFRTEQNEDGRWVEDEDQVMKLKCDFVISAFGSALSSPEVRDWTNRK